MANRSVNTMMEQLSMSCICKQQGLSLISLLVGLFISMLCILTGLTLYKSTLRMSTDSKIDTQLDGQITSALLTLQLELQSAGYGVPGANASDVVKTTHSNKQVLAWRYHNGTEFICRGVKEFETGTSPKYRNLELITADGCSENVDLTTLNWAPADAARTLIGRWPVFGGLATHMTSNTNLFTFSEPAFVSCSPYGALESAQHLQVAISAPSSAALNGASNAVDHSFTLCLLNTNPT